MTIQEALPVTSLLTAATSTVLSDALQVQSATGRVVQASVAGTGSVSATVIIRGSLYVGATKLYVTLATITLSGTTSASDGLYIPAGWLFITAEVTAISGTGAAVDVLVGV